MLHPAQRIRPFLGAKDFDAARAFYRDLGCSESVVSAELSAFQMDEVWFYLQRYYVKEWVQNTMLFLEVADPEGTRESIMSSGVVSRHAGARISEMQQNDWGREFFLHDPSGNLWHIGAFDS